MKKPERKKGITWKKGNPSKTDCKKIGYNTAISDYEAFLPDQGEIHGIIIGVKGVRADAITALMAYEIAKRIGK